MHMHIYVCIHTHYKYQYICVQVHLTGVNYLTQVKSNHLFSDNRLKKIDE